MDITAKEFVSFVTFVLPGFVAAWVFYGLTSHPKPSQFERIVQALVFTFVIQTFVAPCRWGLEKIGEIAPLRPWNAIAKSGISLGLALIMGGTLAWLTNTDSAHKRLRSWGFTTRTSHPSEWFYVLGQKVTFVVLQLRDGRRLYGWPKEWPIERDKGQFYVMLPSWIEEDGKEINLPDVDGILLDAKDVKWVEFMDISKEEQ